MMPDPHHNFLAGGIVVHNSWSFNKSHAVAYGLISYWCCWMKAHFPLEFLAATLNHTEDIERQRAVLRELVGEGFEYQPVDVEHSARKWSLKGNRLIGPLSNIKGVGSVSVRDILAARRNKMPLRPLLQRKLSNPRTPLDTLWPIRDGIQKICPDLKERNIRTPPTPIVELLNSKKSQECVIVGTPAKIDVKDLNEAIYVAKRGYRITDKPTEWIQLRIMDDTGMIFAKISIQDHSRLGIPMLKRGKAKKALYAFKGKVLAGSGDFTMFSVWNARYLGDLEDD